MNDFTKEELQIIIDKFSLLYFSEFIGCGALFVKIQSMIDNYCEHSDQWGCGTCRTFICENEKCDARNNKL